METAGAVLYIGHISKQPPEQQCQMASSKQLHIITTL